MKKIADAYQKHATMAEPPVEAHQAGEVEQNMAQLRACAPDVRMKALSSKIICRWAPKSGAGVEDPPPGAKLVHFIRHGEGFHNVAQREWRTDPNWDGNSEPYTIDNDPDGRYMDAELNEKGRAQAVALQEQTESALKPALLVLSPMRRATLTGLLAFEAHVARGDMPVIAHELLHERAGRHTCDRRLPKAELARLYPQVRYPEDLMPSETDPYWGDGWTREPWETTASRAAAFTEWLFSRSETHVAVACHSAILLALFNAVLECEDESLRTWFGTGEMRSVLLTRG